MKEKLSGSGAEEETAASDVDTAGSGGASDEETEIGALRELETVGDTTGAGAGLPRPIASPIATMVKKGMRQAVSNPVKLSFFIDFQPSFGCTANSPSSNPSV